jgi:hypothetical protein
MGSQGQRRRKPKPKQRPRTAHEQHEAHLHAEQQAVLDNMGFGNSAPWLKVVAIVVIVMLVVSALAGFIILTTR